MPWLYCTEVNCSVGLNEGMEGNGELRLSQSNHSVEQNDSAMPSYHNPFHSPQFHSFSYCERLPLGHNPLSWPPRDARTFKTLRLGNLVISLAPSLFELHALFVLKTPLTCSMACCLFEYSLRWPRCNWRSRVWRY